MCDRRKPADREIRPDANFRKDVRMPTELCWSVYDRVLVDFHVISQFDFVIERYTMVNGNVIPCANVTSEIDICTN